MLAQEKSLHIAILLIGTQPTLATPDAYRRMSNAVACAITHGWAGGERKTPALRPAPPRTYASVPNDCRALRDPASLVAASSTGTATTTCSSPVGARRFFFHTALPGPSLTAVATTTLTGTYFLTCNQLYRITSSTFIASVPKRTLAELESHPYPCAACPISPPVARGGKQRFYIACRSAWGTSYQGTSGHSGTVPPG